MSRASVVARLLIREQFVQVFHRKLATILGIELDSKHGDFCFQGTCELFARIPAREYCI